MAASLSNGKLNRKSNSARVSEKAKPASVKNRAGYRLLVVAHPDDETIFFGGLILKQKTLKQKKMNLPWLVICTTSDGDADRRRQFNSACRALGVEKTEWWAFPDRYDQRLPIDEVITKLQALPPPTEVYTHGPMGEYGHPHHQDVSYAVHRAFAGHPKLFASAYNAFPEFEVKLTPDEYAIKSRILTKVYGSETSRFLNVLPSTFAEGFRRVDMKEIEAVYGYLARGEKLRPRDLSAYKWLTDYLPRLRDLPRPF